MSDDAEILRIQNRALERELRSLRRSLRDDFAKAALPGLLAASNAYTSNYIARKAYELGDAMIAARKEPAA